MDDNDYVYNDARYILCMAVNFQDFELSPVCDNHLLDLTKLV